MKQGFRLLCCDTRSDSSDTSPEVTPSVNNYTLSPEFTVLILFQNIAYTSSKNYQKWFYNNFHKHDGDFTLRERSYSLDSEIDFDECVTARNVSRTTSLETIYESATDDYISDYYSPLPNDLLIYFNNYINFFQPLIRSITFQFSGTAKLKCFINDNQLFLSVMLPRSCDIADETHSIGTFAFSKTLTDFWNTLETNSQIFDLITTVPLYDKVNIVAHYRNTYFADFLVYKLVTKYRIANIRYLSLLPDRFHDDWLYANLDSAVDMLIFSEYSVNVKNYRKVNTCYDSCCMSRANYRRNLKQHSKKILEDIAARLYV